MNNRKEHVLETHLERISYYACYVDCFTRIINEFTENGDENLENTDIPNLSNLSAKYARHLYKSIINMKRDFEFLK